MTQNQRAKSKYAYDGQVAQKKRRNLYGNEKILKIVGIIILALILIILIYFSTIHFNDFLKKDNVMTREEVVALLRYEGVQIYDLANWLLKQEK